VPAEVSMVFGKESSFTRILTRCTLRLDNRRVNEVDSLVISVAGR
jgi:hypothetical protein